MYREHLMDHYKHPRNHGELESPTVSHTEKNPSCGDTITMDFLIEDGKVKDVRFRGEGCAISMAAASMLAEELPGKKVEQVVLMPRDEMLELIGVPLTTMRVKCGLLALHTAKKALAKNLGEEAKGEW